MTTRHFYGYTIVATSFFIQAVCIGAMFTYGVFFKEFQQEFGWSRALISGASSVAFFVMGAGAIIAGTMNDRIGPRRILTVSSIFIGLGYLLMSRMSAPWQLYLFYGLFVGIGFSTHDVITLSTIARWFVRYRGIMSGIVKVGTGAGQFTVPLLAAVLISTLGWRNAYLIIGGVVLAALVSLSQFMKRDPRILGLWPDGDQRERYGHASPAEDRSLSLRAALRNRHFLGICLSEFCIFLCIFTIMVHIAPHALDQGLSPTVAASVLSMIGGMSILGRFTMGMVNDRIGGRRSLIICFLVMIGSFVLLQFAGRSWTLFLFGFIYGFAHGGVFTVMSPMIAEFFGIRAHGQLFGAVLFVGTIGATIGPLLTGVIFDLTGEYRLAFMALTVFAAAGIVPIACLPKDPAISAPPGA